MPGDLGDGVVGLKVLLVEGGPDIDLQDDRVGVARALGLLVVLGGRRRLIVVGLAIPGLQQAEDPVVVLGRHAEARHARGFPRGERRHTRHPDDAVVP